jgi:hypothetical protein
MSSASDLLERIHREKEETDALKALWPTILPEQHLPSDRTFLIWLNRYHLPIIAEGIRACAAWMSQVESKAEDGTKPNAGPMTKDRLVKYASGCMKKIAERAEKGRNGNS